MPHSLKVRLKNLQRKGELTEKDIDRIFNALEQEPCENHEEKPHSLLDAYFQMRAEQEPCDDAISREDAIAEMEELNAVSFYEANEHSKEAYYEIKNMIKTIPSVRPQEQTGHWIRQNNTKEPLYGWYFCSECNSVIGDKTKFCSNCGARMVEPQESEEQPLSEELVEHYRKLAEHYDRQKEGKS